MRTRILVGLASVGLLATLLGCGGDDDSTKPVDDIDEANSTTTGADEASTTTTIDPDSDAGQALAVYDRMWKVLYEAIAVKPPDPMYPKLGEVLTGDAAQSVADILTKANQDGQYTTGSIETHPQVTTDTPTLVVLSDCTLAHSKTYDVATNAEVSKSSQHGQTRRVEIRKGEDGVWRVSLIESPEGERCTPE